MPSSRASRSRSFQASEASPLVNVCLVVKEWGDASGTVRIVGAAPTGGMFVWVTSTR